MCQLVALENGEAEYAIKPEKCGKRRTNLSLCFLCIIGFRKVEKKCLIRLVGVILVITDDVEVYANVDCMLTTGYICYINEGRGVNLYISLGFPNLKERLDLSKIQRSYQGYGGISQILRDG